MSKADDNYKLLRTMLDERLKADKRLAAIADKIAKGTADFTDTAKYTHIVSHHMGKVISENIGKITAPLGKEAVCKELLRDHYDLINGVFGDVQVSVDEKMGIHIKPVKPAYPAERVDSWAHSLEDPTVEQSVIERRAASGSENIGNSMHDDCVKENAKLHDKVGLDTYLVRDAGGGCCAWCAAIAGRYKYADAPDDVFRRHDNCTCTVTYECGRMRQDVWSKKTWEVSDEELKARKEASEAAQPKVYRNGELKELSDSAKPKVFTPEQAKALEAKALGKEDVDFTQKNDKMSANSDSILEPQRPTIHTKEEIDEITKYAEDNGIKLYQPQNFDGDISVLKDQIDAISEVRNEYGLTSKLTIEFKDLRGGDLAETSRTGASIAFDRNALRNREATNKFLQADNTLATNDVKGIAYHEMGHILSKTYGEKGLDIACKAYYNIYKDNISKQNMLGWLRKNISRYSVDISEDKMEKAFNPKLYKEVTPEILSLDKTNSTIFTSEFSRLLKEAYGI